MKKFLIILIVLGNVANLIAASSGYFCNQSGAFAVYYSISNDTVAPYTVCANCVRGDGTTLSIPETVSYNNKTYRVTMVAQLNDINGMRNVESVTLPEGLLGIGFCAFANCPKLTSINIPRSVKTIGRYAFSNCPGLSSILIPNGVMTIDDYAFMKCTSLSQVTIPESITSLGNDVFFECANLTTVVWNAGKCKKIGSRVFSVEYKHPEKTIPITSFTFGNSVQYIPNNLCQYLDKITTIDIPNSVKSIGDSAFVSCKSLSSVIIGESVTAIGGSAFYGCTSLSSITIPNSVQTIGSWAFTSCDSLSSVIIGDGVETIGERAFWCCDSLSSITIPNSVQTIGSWAFASCDSLSSVIIGEGVETIGESAFYGCTSLSSITIPNSVTAIGSGAFENCTSLSSVIIGEGVETIGSGAFYVCKSLSSITIPNSVTAIGSGTFENCTSLSSVIIGEGVKTIGNGAFASCEGLSSVIIGSGAIGESAFYGCTSLSSVIMGESVTTIGSWAFERCTSLSSITIPNSVTTIGSWAFTSCDSLSSVIIGDGVETIGESAFRCKVDTFRIGRRVRNLATDCLTTLKDTCVIYSTSPFVEHSWLSAFLTTAVYQLYVNCELYDSYISVFGDKRKFTIKGIDLPTITVTKGNDEFDTYGYVRIVQNNDCSNKNYAIIEANSNSKFDSCFVFSHWNDGNTDNPRTIKVTQDTTIIAHFDRQAYEIVIDDNPEAGTVSIFPKKKFYCKRNSVTLTVTPNDGYVFKGWSDGNLDNPRTLVVTDNVTVSPIYEKVTALDDVVSDAKKPYKIIYQGQMYIIRDGVIYTATGTKL